MRLNTVPEFQDGLTIRKPPDFDTIDAKPRQYEDKRSAGSGTRFDATSDTGHEVYEARFTARLPRSLTPSFKSYAIALSYRLQLLVKAKVADKEFFFVEEAKIVVLPPPEASRAG